jgi:hypothetical protein
MKGKLARRRKNKRIRMKRYFDKRWNRTGIIENYEKNTFLTN